MTDIDRNFNNTIDEYYSNDIGSEFEDDLTQSEIDEFDDLLEQGLIQQLKKYNEVKKWI